MKKFTIKNYNGNFMESLKQFSESHKKMKIVEAIEDADFLKISAIPTDDETTMSDIDDNQCEQTTDSCTSVDSFFTFGSKLLIFGVQVHFWHLNCSKNAEHLALKDLYEACDDVGDRILEAAIGMSNKPATIQDSCCSSELYNQTTSIEEITQIKNEAAGLIGTDAGMDNILGEFCETCNSVIYKLKKFH